LESTESPPTSEHLQDVAKANHTTAVKVSRGSDDTPVIEYDRQILDPNDAVSIEVWARERGMQNDCDDVELLIGAIRDNRTASTACPCSLHDDAAARAQLGAVPRAAGAVPGGLQRRRHDRLR
jgi:hypothetical protein